MHSKTSEDEVENDRNDRKVMMTMDRCKIKGLFAEEADRTYAERTQAEHQAEMEKNPFNMLQPGNSAV